MRPHERNNVYSENVKGLSYRVSSGEVRLEAIERVTDQEPRHGWRRIGCLMVDQHTTDSGNITYFEMSAASS